jgi:hypothetical protein
MERKSYPSGGDTVLDLMKAPMKSRLRLISLAVTLVAVLPLRCLAQTQEVTYSNRVPVYVGDLVNEADASVDSQHAGRLCGRLNRAIKGIGIGKADKHNSNCVFHIVRFSDLTDPSKVQTVDVQHWYVFSNDQFWSLEDLQQNKRLFGEPEVSFFFIHINRAFSANIARVAVAGNVLTVSTDQTLEVGRSIGFSGVTTAAFLNGQHLKVKSVTATGFTADFTHGDYAAAPDNGTVIFNAAGDPTSPPTPGPPPTQTQCDQVPKLPPTGADGYYASYTIDVKRKVSANVQHLFALLGAAGLKNATEISTSGIDVPSLLAKQDVINSLTKVKTTVCRQPDSEFGGGTVDVAYRPSDMSVTSSLKSGVGGHEVVVAIDKNAYVVDNEGRYFVDFSVPVTLKNLSAVEYQSTGSTFFPVNTNSLNAFLAVDGYFPANDVKSQNWTRYPHPLGGVAFAKQPLSRILLAGAWGPSFSELYIGAAWVKQPRVAEGSNSCSGGGASTTTPNSFGSHYCVQFSIGLNLSVTSIANKLGSPK